MHDLHALLFTKLPLSVLSLISEMGSDWLSPTHCQLFSVKNFSQLKKQTDQREMKI